MGVRHRVVCGCRGTVTDGSSATRRQHRDYWQDKRAPLHHEDLADSFFAQIPPIPSGKPPSKSKPGTFSPILVCPRGHETVQNISQCCRRTSTCTAKCLPHGPGGSLSSPLSERDHTICLYRVTTECALCSGKKVNRSIVLTIDLLTRGARHMGMRLGKFL